MTGIFADWWLRILLNRTGDDHARLRRLANPALSPKLIIPLQPRFAGIANDIIDKFAARGRCDFVAEFCEPRSLSMRHPKVGRSPGYPSL